MTHDSLPEPDRAEGAPHPSQTRRLIGQDDAQAAVLDAYTQGRLHHAWLITGPSGIGKATLAWRMARFLLATAEQDQDHGLFATAPSSPTSLDIPADHPVARRMTAGSEAGLFVLRRGYNEKTKRLRAVITVDDVRKLKNFFGLSATDGGRRVVIVDAADEMNPSAANALLKVLEEPPAKTFLLLVSHQPSRLLPTIRSRCRVLRLQPLTLADMHAALVQADVDLPENAQGLMALANGSVGDAVRLSNLNGLGLYHAILSVLKTMPDFDRQAAIALAESIAGRGKEDQRALTFSLFDLILARIARAGVIAPDGPEVVPGETGLFQRLCPDAAKARQWAQSAQEISDRNQHGLAVNLDPAALILDTVFKIQQTVKGGSPLQGRT